MARDGDAGLLSARQLMREPVQQVDRKADQPCQFLAAGTQRIATPVAELHHRVDDGARAGKARIETVGRVLEHHLDARAQRQPRKRVGQDGADLVTVEYDAPRGLVQQPHHHHRGGGLAAAGFADQPDALAMTDGKTDAVDRAELVPMP
jgi:hypothetical protein